MRALVVSGGGSKGAFAVGVIKALLEQGRSWDIFAGTSTGALITPLVATGDFDVAEHIYTTVRTRDLLRRRCVLTLPWASSLYKTDGLERVIRDTLTFERWAALSDKHVIATTVSLNSGNVCYWRPSVEGPDGLRVDKETYMRALLASSNQPGLMPAVQIRDGGEYHVDGGVREIAPIVEAARRGATEIDAVIMEPKNAPVLSQEFDNMAGCFVRALGLFMEEILVNDIVTAEASGAKVRVIRPEAPLPTDGLTFNPKIMQQMLNNGYETAARDLNGQT